MTLTKIKEQPISNHTTQHPTPHTTHPTPHTPEVFSNDYEMQIKNFNNEFCHTFEYITTMAFYKYRPWQRACDFLYFQIGSILWTKYFIYGYTIVSEVICEDLGNIMHIIGEIWAYLFLWIT